jgi:hypothetical protein
MVKLFCIYLLLFLAIIGCTTTTTQPIIAETHPVRTLKTGFTPAYLNWSENTFRDFFGKEETKKAAMEQLRIRCHEPNLRDANSCYNLAVLNFYFIKDYEEAYKHSARAAALSPDDFLYRDLYRHSCIKANKMDILELNYPYQSKLTYQYSKLLDSCENKTPDLFILEELVKNGTITKPVLSTGALSECLTKEEQTKYSTMAKNNPINYTYLYYKEKDKANMYSDIWDTMYYTKGQKLISYDRANKNITVYWKEILKGITSNNMSEVEKNVALFVKEVRTGKNNDKKNTILYTALERAAFLLFEQDEFFKNYRHLAKEFE